MDIFMESHGIEVVDLDLKECRELMEGYIGKNKALWDEFLSELNPHLLIPEERGPSLNL